MLRPDPGARGAQRGAARNQRQEGSNMRNLKALGLALLAVFALSAVAASAAQAEYKLTPQKSPAFIKGEQIAHAAGNKLEITSKGTKVECKTATYEGTVSGATVTDATVTPSYGGCTANGGLEAIVDVNGCTITLTGETNTAKEGIVHLLCPETKPGSGVLKEIEVTIPEISCAIKVHAQTPTSGGVTYTNNETNKPDDVEATANLGGITYERAGTTAGCIAAVPKEGNDAILLTKITITAFEDTNGVKGSQINLTKS
jgi:hypothetical protein